MQIRVPVKHVLDPLSHLTNPNNDIFRSSWVFPEGENRPRATHVTIPGRPLIYWPAKLIWKGPYVSILILS